MIDAVVNDKAIKLKIHVVSKDSISFTAIVENNLLSQVEVRIQENGIMVYKKESGFF